MTTIELINFSEQPKSIEKGSENNRSLGIPTNDPIKAWHSIGLRAKTAMYEFLEKLAKGQLDQLHVLENYTDQNNFQNEANLATVKKIVKIKALKNTKHINLLKEDLN